MGEPHLQQKPLLKLKVNCYWNGAERQLSAEGAPRSVIKFGSLLFRFGLVSCRRHVNINLYGHRHTDIQTRGKKRNYEALMGRFKSSSIGQTRLHPCGYPHPSPASDSHTSTAHRHPSSHGLWAPLKNNNGNRSNDRDARMLFCPESTPRGGCKS